MKKLLIFISVVSVFSESYASKLEEPDSNIMKEVYSGNPRSKNLKTYVYLCRKSRGSGKWYESPKCNGLSVSFITTDGDFYGFDSEETRNIVWSASTNYSKDGFKFEYVYNYKEYKNSEEIFNDKQGIPDSLSYLHLLTGKPCMSEKVSDYAAAEDGELRIVKTLKSALFRWEIPGKKLSDILECMGELGEDKEIKGRTVKVIPRYARAGGSHGISLSGLFDVDNCATFSAGIVSKAVGISVSRKSAASEELAATGICGLVGLAGCGVSLGVSFLLPGIGPTLAVAALMTAADACIIKSVAPPSAPNTVINSLLECYVSIDSTQNNKRTKGNFKIVAHDVEEFKKNYRQTEGLLKPGERRNKLAPYNNFKLKNVEEAERCKLRIGKLKRKKYNNKKLEDWLGNIFLTSDFGDSEEASSSV